MTGKKELSRKPNMMLFCVAYFFCYLSRQNYAAVLTEIIRDMNVSKSIAGLAITGSLISYGVCQTVSGIFGDKVRPEKMIFAGLLGSAVSNLLIWVFPNIYFMNAVWCINGAFQALVWPPLVRMIIETLGESKLSKTIVRVTQASYCATVFMYLFVPVVISFANWRWIFAFSGFAVMVFSFYWLYKTKSYEVVLSEKKERAEKSRLSKYIILGFLPIIISTLIAGFLRDGISTWMPTYINESYNLGSNISILTGAVIPVCCALFLDLLNYIGEKVGNELKTASLFFAVALASCSALYLCFSKIPALDVAFMSLITVCVHGVNLMLVGNVPKHFAKYGKSSAISGILNSAVYAGSAVSVYATASLSALWGWRAVILAWIGVIVLAFVLCFNNIKRQEAGVIN